MKNGIKLTVNGQPTQQDYQDTIQVLSEDCARYYGESALEEFNHAVVINVEKKLLEEMTRTNNAEYQTTKLRESNARLLTYLENSTTCGPLIKELAAHKNAIRVLYSALMKIEEQEDLAEEISGVDRKYSRLIQKHLEAAENALGEEGNLKDYE